MTIVVVGGGLAGASAVEELRDQGYAGDIVLTGAEPHLPYERPPLSKGVLQGMAEPASAILHDAAWYADRQVDLRLGTPVDKIDLDLRHVIVGDEVIPYDRVLLTTGAVPRRLPALDQTGLPVRYLRTLDDAVEIRQRLASQGPPRILVVGAGWIGLEVAAAARLAGSAVTVVENAALPLLGVLGPEIAQVFAELHREHGVDLRLGTSVAEVEGATVALSDGHRLAPDLVVVGIGAVPATATAARSGLATDNGVLVDARLRTSDPHVFAAGDVANHDHPLWGRLRVEHWDNAIEQGRHAARAMLGADEAYKRQPYFFSDQYDVGMEYVGRARPGDRVVVRGSLTERAATAWWVRDGVVTAAMHLNDWDAIESMRSAVGQQAGPWLSGPGIGVAASVFPT